MTRAAWTPGLCDESRWTYDRTNKQLLRDISQLVLRWKKANLYWLYYIFIVELCRSDKVCPPFILISTGQRVDTISSESRRHRLSVEEPCSPKATNGTAIRPASASGSYNESLSATPKLVSEVNEELLASGALILPGRTDVSCSRSSLHILMNTQT